MRRVTKAAAMQELGVSLSTLDRMIRRGDVEVERERHGRRDRVYVMLDGDDSDMVDDAVIASNESESTSVNASSGSAADVSAQSALSIAQARIASLEELVKWHQERHALADARYHELNLQLTRALPAPAGPPTEKNGRSWWKVWSG